MEIIINNLIVIYFLIDVRKFKNQLLFKLIIFPMLILIWEPAIFFFPYLLLIDLVSFRINKFNINLIYIFLSYLLVFLTTIFIYLNPFSTENFNTMTNVLANDFGEKCYMSCSFVGNQSQNSISELFNHHAAMIEFPHLVRYILIVLIGFFAMI